MLATGGSAARACTSILAGDPASLRMVCIVAAPEGIRVLAEAHPSVDVFAASLDRELNEVGYILPGIGDFGDRLQDGTRLARPAVLRLPALAMRKPLARSARGYRSTSRQNRGECSGTRRWASSCVST